MNKALITSSLLTAASSSVFSYEAVTGPTGVLKYAKDRVYDGYTLYAPNQSTTTYLLNMRGFVVHEWHSTYRPGAKAELLENGHLLRNGKIEPPETLNPLTWGGVAGVLQEFDWKGNVVWEYRDSDADSVTHHTFHRMPNGNTLILIWEFHSKAEALAKGRNPETVLGPGDPGFKPFLNGIWAEKIVEVNTSGETVWQWRAWEHLGNGPFQLDINYRLPLPMSNWRSNADWMHANALDYLATEDLILLGSPSFSEFYLIDHATGDLVYRWGNPCTYRAGKCPSYMNEGDQILFGAHGAAYIEAGLAGTGNILMFDNGWMRPTGTASRVLEVNPTTSQIVWEYKTLGEQSIHSDFQGAAQRLANGNTLITSANQGHLIEVTSQKEIVWEFINPIFGFYPNEDEVHCEFDEQLVLPNGAGRNALFAAYRYGPDYPGLLGKDLPHVSPTCPSKFGLGNKSGETS